MNDLNMQKSKFKLYKFASNFDIETLLVMELIGKEKMTVQITMFMW